MDTKDKSPLVGGILVIVAIVGLIGLGAFTLAGRGTGDVELQDESGQSTAPTEDRPSTSGGTSGAGAADEVREGSVAVEISDFKYSPASITVKRGTIVTWTNRDSARHDVAPEQMSDGAPRSELLGQGETYSHAFDTVGTYEYYCSPHPYMKGSVTVVE